MTHAPHLIATLVRAATVAAGGTMMAHILAGLLRSKAPAVRRWFWGLLLIPFITPVLLVGYTYATWSVSLTARAQKEVLYGALMLLRLTPVAVVVLHFAPRTVSPEAVHAWRLVRRRSGRILSPVFPARLVAPAAAWGVVFLLAFVEFEMASLMFMKSWTVALFDQHVISGLGLDASLAMAGLPALCQAAAFIGVLALLFTGRSEEASFPRRRPGVLVRVLAWLFMGVAVLVVCGVPVAYLLIDAARNLAAFRMSSFLWKEIAAGLLFASVAAGITYCAAGWLAESAGRRRGRLLAGGLLSLPGLLGPLVLSLCVLALFMAPVLRPLYNSPAPLLLALAALLWPLAFLLRAVLLVPEGESRYAAALLELSTHAPVSRRAVRLGRLLRNRGAVWVGFLLFCWAYFDLTASAVLSPPGMATATARLYNLMHYGRMATLSVMVLMTVAVAVLVLLALLGAQRMTRLVTDA